MVWSALNDDALYFSIHGPKACKANLEFFESVHPLKNTKSGIYSCTWFLIQFIEIQSLLNLYIKFNVQ